MTREEIREFGQHIADKLFHKKEQNNTVVIKGWIAKDQINAIYFYAEKPIKGDWEWNGQFEIAFLNDNCFPQLNWEDNEPTPCEITIKIDK